MITSSWDLWEERARTSRKGEDLVGKIDRTSMVLVIFLGGTI